MARKKKSGVSADMSKGEGGFDMTPMIDVTFLLLIFFMLITQLADASKSKLSLPRAVKAIPDDIVIPGRVIINILKTGDVVIMGQKYDDKSLDSLLALQAKISKAGSADGFPTQAILVRVDGRTEYRHVEHVMAMCMYRQIWKIAFGTADPTNPNGM